MQLRNSLRLFLNRGLGGLRRFRGLPLFLESRIFSDHTNSVRVSGFHRRFGTRNLRQSVGVSDAAKNEFVLEFEAILFAANFPLPNLPFASVGKHQLGFQPQYLLDGRLV